MNEGLLPLLISGRIPGSEHLNLPQKGGQFLACMAAIAMAVLSIWVSFVNGAECSFFPSLLRMSAQLLSDCHVSMWKSTKSWDQPQSQSEGTFSQPGTCL